MERLLTLDKLPARVLKELNLETVFFASRLVIAAERLQVFRKLAGGPRTVFLSRLADYGVASFSLGSEELATDASNA